MTLRSKLALARAALRSVQYLLDGRIRFPRGRLGDVLELPGGDAFVVYRETILGPAAAAASGDEVVLVFRMRVDEPGVGETVGDVLVDPLANVATPFFAGMPGFRRKLWLAGERPGEFLELYEWATAGDAERFVAVLESLLDPLEFAADASFDVVEDDSIDDYVAARSLEWRDAARRTRGRRRKRRRRIGAWALVAIGLVVGGYLAWTRGSRRERAATREPEVRWSREEGTGDRP